MTEETLGYLSLDDLYSLIVKTIDEYLVLHKHPAIQDGIEEKRIELALIQKVIQKKIAKHDRR